MLKAIHAQEDKVAAGQKALLVVEKLRSMKLAKAAEIVEHGIGETLSYYDLPSEHSTTCPPNYWKIGLQGSLIIGTSLVVMGLYLGIQDPPRVNPRYASASVERAIPL